MNGRNLVAWAAGVLTLAGAAQADLIATVDNSGAGGTGSFHTEMGFLIQMDDEDGDPWFGDDFLFDTDDDGAVVSFMSNADDAEYDLLVSVITNGVLDTISFRRLLGSNAAGSVGTEGFWFYGDNTGASGIDLAAWTIDEIRLTVNSIDITHPELGGGTNYSYDVTWEFFGTEVPAPGACALLGLAGLAGARRRRRTA